MAQHDYVIANGTGAAVRSDLNNALAAIVTQNSGATAPATTYAYQWWADTTTGLLKIRNAANNAWITLRELDGTLTIEDGTASSPGLAFADDLNTGIYSPSADQLGITTGGTVRLTTTTTGITSALPVDVPLGTASAPTVTFTGDLNTGIYSPGADQVAISTNGSGRLFVNSSGSVGIGTSSPQAALSVIGSAGSGDAGVVIASGSTTVGSKAALFFSASTAQNLSGSAIKTERLSPEGSDLQFYTCLNDGVPLQRLKIDSSGRVGIGTTSPAQKLDVSGAIRVLSSSSDFNTESGQIDFDSSSGAARISAYKSTGSSVQFFTNSSSGTVSERLRIDSSGRLLVGTSSAFTGVPNPAEGGTQTRTTFFTSNIESSQQGVGIYNFSSVGYAPSLDLALSKTSSIGSYSIVASGNALGHINFGGSDGSKFLTGAYIGAYVDGTPGTNDMPGRLVFSTTADGASSPTERMRINQKGEFKASTTGTYPSATTGGHQFRTAENLPTLTIDNNITSGFTDTVLQVTLGYVANTTNSWFIYCNDPGGQRFSVRTNGGISNYQANNVNLSDRNAKKDISPAADTWDCIKEWEIVNYRYKDQPDDADLNLGVIAQQVAESCPEVITVFEEAKEDQPERLGVKEQQMYWMAIKALQEAQVRIEQLETEKTEQQTVLDDLLARVAALEGA